MKKLRLLSALLVIAVVVGLLGAMSFAAVSKTLTFKDSSIPIKFNYSALWKESTFKSPSTLIILNKGKSELRVESDQLETVLPDSTPAMTVSAYATDIVKQYIPAGISGAKIGKIKVVKLKNGVYTASYEATYTDSLTKSSMKVIRTCASKDKTLIIISYTALAKDYSKDLQYYNMIINSLSFSK